MMPLYLRLLQLDSEPNSDAERSVIVRAIANAGFELLREPEKHPRGGFSVHVDCDETQHSALLESLESHRIFPVI